MPKPNIPTDTETLKKLAAVPADAVIDRLENLLAAAEKAEQQVTEMREAGRKRIPKGLRDQALEVPHLAALIDRIKAEPREVRVQLSQLAVAQNLVQKGETDAKTASRKRYQALHVLHARYKVQKVKLYGPYGIGRMKLSNAFKVMPGAVPDITEEQAWQDADRWHANYTTAISVEDTARKFRDGLFARLERPTHAQLNDDTDGPGYAPVDLERVSGLGASRITQIRTGSSNASRARKAREEREARKRAALAGPAGHHTAEKISA